MVDVALVREFAARLKKLIKKQQVADSRDEVDEILTKLGGLRKPSIELLSETKIGVPVQRLTDPAKAPGADKELRDKAAAIVAVWKRRVAKLEGKNKPKKPAQPAKPVKPAKSRAASKTGASSPRDGGGGGGSKATTPRSPRGSSVEGALPPPGSTPEEKLAFFSKRFEFWNRDLDLDTMRAKHRMVIFKKLAQRRAALRGLAAGGLAALDDRAFFVRLVERAEAVETKIHAVYNKKAALLKSKIQNLVFGLGSNPSLVESVVTGTLRPQELVRMTPEQMQTEQEQKLLQEEVEKEYDTLDKDQQQAKALKLAQQYRLTKSDGLYYCGKCGTNKHTQMIDQRQTRSADEPMTVTVLCEKCKTTWRTEG